MRLSAVAGLNWGDEGKGRMVDLLAEDCDAVVRYQGGGNAGHTVENELGKFALLLPWHRQEDALEEARPGAHKYGSTVQGIAPFYGDKYRKKVLRAGDLRFPERLEEEVGVPLGWLSVGPRREQYIRL